MTAPVHRKNYRVVIEVDDTYLFTRDPEKRDAIMLERTRVVVDGIKRHIDGIGTMRIAYDHVCAHCGYPWEDIPGCCNKAVEWYEEQERATQATIDNGQFGVGA